MDLLYAYLFSVALYQSFSNFNGHFLPLYHAPYTIFHDFLVFVVHHCCRAFHLGSLYLCSLLVLLVYSILYGLTAKESHWLGAITSAAVIVLGTHA